MKNNVNRGYYIGQHHFQTHGMYLKTGGYPSKSGRSTQHKREKPTRKYITLTVHNHLSLLYMDFWSSNFCCLLISRNSATVISLVLWNFCMTEGVRVSVLTFCFINVFYVIDVPVSLFTPRHPITSHDTLRYPKDTPRHSTAPNIHVYISDYYVGSIFLSTKDTLMPQIYMFIYKIIK